MPQIHRKSSRAALAVLVLAIAAIALAACGGSSKGTTTTTAASGASASSTTGVHAPALSPNRQAVRECLQKHGIALPKPTSGRHRPPGGGGFFGGGGPHGQLPKGMTVKQSEIIIRKCGDGFRPGTFSRGFNTPAVKKDLEKYVACMRENGVKLPAPSTSGSFIFNTKGIDTHSATFKAAEAKCHSDLPDFFGARHGAGPGAGGAAPPPAG